MEWRFKLMESNWSKPYDLKRSNFQFSKNEWPLQSGQLFVPWPISAAYVIATYENNILNKTRPTCIHKDHLIPHFHTLIGFLHKKSMDAVEETFHGTKVVNLLECKFYKKLVLKKGNNKEWHNNNQELVVSGCKLRWYNT